MGLAKAFLAIGISLLLAVFFAYAVYVIYEPPVEYGQNTCYTQYDCYSKTQICYAKYNCYGEYPGKGYPSMPVYYNNTINETEIQVCAEEQNKCILGIETSTEYKECFENQAACIKESLKTDPHYIYSRNTFYIFAAISLITIFVGMSLIVLEGIGSGLIGGAILLVFWNIGYSWEYVSNLNKYIKLVLLGMILALLIYLGYKRIEKAGKDKGSSTHIKKKKGGKK
jgi:hypothetical protein